MMTTLLDADSLGEAIQRAIASVTIMNASNSIVEQQQKTSRQVSSSKKN